MESVIGGKTVVCYFMQHVFTLSQSETIWSQTESARSCSGGVGVQVDPVKDLAGC